MLLAADTGDHPDVLAHVSVRARNLKVLLCVLFDQEKCDEIAAMENKHIFLQSQSSNDVKFELQNPNQALTRAASSALILKTAIENASDIRDPPEFQECVLGIDDFNNSQMGAKSNNLKVLSDSTPDWMHVPESICLPFKLMEHCLASCDPQGNNRIVRLTRRLTRTKKVGMMAARLLKCKKIILNLSYEKTIQNDQTLRELK